MNIGVLSVVSTAWSKSWPVVIAILFFGIVIMVHELGHFLFAKLFDVKVNQFALGMGPSILRFRKGETRYSLRLFPIGGYCLMEGEDEESRDIRSFSKKPVWKRFIIVGAGAVVNLILGLVIVAIMLGSGKIIGTTQIKSFTEKSSTQAAGLKAGDILTDINGKKVYSQYDISFLMMRDKDAVLDIGVERNGKKMMINDVKLKTATENGVTRIVYDFIIVGVKPSFTPLLKYSFLETISMSRIVWISFLDLITGQYGFKSISGPIGVVSYMSQAVQHSTRTDITPILSLMALITINIGIFNLLPVPALDGGRLFFMLVEMIRRKPVPHKYESWIHAAGLILLLLFMAIVSFKDIIVLIRG